MSKLEIKRIYVDTRYRAPSSRSNSDFQVDLPMTLEIPENTKLLIDDISLPVSWTSINSTHHALYVKVAHGATDTYYKLVFPHLNYTGTSFAQQLAELLNTGDLQALGYFNATVAFDITQNNVSVQINDIRVDKSLDLSLTFLSQSFIEANSNLWADYANDNLNSALNIYTNIELVPAFPKVFYLSLFKTRNVYMVSSRLGSFNSISNFNVDGIVAKIEVDVPYNSVIVHRASGAHDAIDISRRNINNFDIRLVNSNNEVLELNSHWSFTIKLMES